MAESVEIRITASNGASQVFRAVASDAQKMGDAIKDAGQAGQQGGGFSALLQQVDDLGPSFKDAGQAMVAFGGAITAASALGFRSFASLESAMANVNSIAGQTDAQLAATTDQIRALAIELGTSPTGLAEGLYDIVSSGFDAAEGMQVLEASAIAARAGLTDTGTAATAITAVLNAYGKGADEAAAVSDVLFKTVDSGVITFEELSTSMGRVLPLASTLSVEVEELGAAYAEMTLRGISAAEAETALRAIMTAAINPTTALAEAVEEYGYQSAEALIRTEGLAGFLQFLDEAAGGSATRMGELTGNVRANDAALVLAQDSAAGYIDRLVEMENAGGRTAEVFATQMDTVQASVDRAGAAIRDLGITLGAAIAPAVDGAAQAVSGYATILRALPDSLQTAAAATTAFGGATALMAGGMLLVVPRIAETITAFQRLRAAMIATGAASTALRLTPIGLALTGVAVAGALVTKSWLDQREAAAEYDATLGSLADTLEQVRRQGDLALAERGTDLQDQILEVERLNEAYENQARFVQDILGEQPAHPGFEPAAFAEQTRLWEEFREAVGDTAIDSELTADAVRAVDEALRDTNVRGREFVQWAQSLLDEASLTESLEDDQAALEAIAATVDEMPEEFLINVETNADEAAATVSAAGSFIGQTLAEIVTDAEEAGEALASALEEGTEAFHDQVGEWIADGDNIIGFLNDLIPTIEHAGGWMEQFFNREWELNLDLSGAATALDQVLRTFDQIESLGQRSSAAGAIADALFGPDGDPNDAVGPLRDLYDVGRIGQTQFNEAIEHGVQIQYRAAEAEALLNELRVDQLPLLRAHQDAYVEQLDALTRLEPAEQRRVLMLQDTAVRTQIADLYAQAYAASVGQIPEEVATDMIVNAAQADADLASLLLAFGLIEETVGPNGELSYEVNLPGADESIQAMDRLTIAMFELNALQQDLEGFTGFDLAVEILGKDEAEALYGLVEEKDGTTSTVTVAAETTPEFTTAASSLEELADRQVLTTWGIETTGSEEAQQTVDDLAVLDGASVLTSLNIDTTGAESAQEAAGAVEEIDGTTAEATVTTTVVNAEALGDVFELLRTINESGAATLSVTVEADTSDITSTIALLSGAAGGGGGNVGGFAAPTITVDFEANTQPVADALNAIRGGSANPEASAAATITVDFIADTSAVQLENLDLPDDIEIQATITADNLQALGAIDSAQRALGALDGDVAQITVNGVNTSAITAISEASTALTNLDGDVATVTINAIDNASGVIGGVSSGLAALDGRSATSYVNTVNTTTFQTIGTRPLATGGTIWSGLTAQSGRTVLVGEAGPELVNLPHGSQVTPHGASMSRLEGMREPAGETYIFNNYGTVIGIEDVAESMQGAVNKRRRGHAGVTA